MIIKGLNGDRISPSFTALKSSLPVSASRSRVRRHSDLLLIREQSKGHASLKRGRGDFSRPFDREAKAPLPIWSKYERHYKGDFKALAIDPAMRYFGP